MQPMLTLFLTMIVAPGFASTWEQTLERVVPSVVMIRSYAPRSFDGKVAGSSYATGFVVDTERGIILTNRHVVQPGPVVAEAVLQNNEEIVLTPIYRDPVHDFGFFQYDPKAVRFHEMEALQLVPEHARQGTAIRLVGSDAGEKVSILAGTLARLDRGAPFYGAGRFNDFNTFYIQAASSSSGGSSGSPVLDVHGHVVALNAGSNRRAASSFFLPLDRVARALKQLVADQKVSRGTIHTTFVHKPFDEAARLGLTDALEAAVRREHPTATGVLVVERVLRGGSASGALEPGDILLGVEGQRITQFVPLEAALDDSVGQNLGFEIARGGAEQSLTLQVGDLMDVSPDEYVEIGDGIFHAFSYQVARHHELPIGGVFVSRPGYLLGGRVRKGQVITHINGVAVPDLDAFQEAIGSVADKEAFTIRSLSPSEPGRPLVATAKMDRTWFEASRCRRVDGQRSWSCEALAPAPSGASVTPITASPLKVSHKIAKQLANGMVMVNFEIPYRTSGVYGKTFGGVGLVVDADQGLVLVDRDTVTVGLGDVTVRFASSVEVEGWVVALHPQNNLALIRYDPVAIGETPVTTIRFDGARLEPGDKAFHVGMSVSDRIDAEKVTVSDLSGLSLPIPEVPFYRQTNLELIDVRGSEGGFMGGVLTDKRGKASAIVASFPILNSKEGSNIWRGIPGHVVNAFLDDSRGAKMVGVEWGVTGLIHARDRGLEGASAAALEAHDPEKRQILQAVRVTRGSVADGVIEPGDILVSVNGAPVTRIGEWSRGVQTDTLGLRVLRGSEERDISLEPRFQSSRPFEPVLQWGGALFHAPHDPIASQRGQPLDGVYVCYWWRGSPAGRYGLRPMRRVVSVDGQPTPDLQTFAAAVVDKASGDPVRLTTVDLKGRKRMITMKADTDYWPLVSLSHGDGGWTRTPVQPAANGDSGARGGDDVRR